MTVVDDRYGVVGYNQNAAYLGTANGLAGAGAFGQVPTNTVNVGYKVLSGQRVIYVTLICVFCCPCGDSFCLVVLWCGGVSCWSDGTGAVVFAKRSWWHAHFKRRQRRA